MINKYQKKNVQKELLNIYKDRDGNMPNMAKIERRKKKKFRNILIFIVIFFAFLTAISWAGFFFFKPYQNNGKQDIYLNIKTPEKIRSGEKTTFTVEYQNQESAALSKTQMELRYPSNFQLIEAKPAPTQQDNVWALGSLAQVQEGKIEITGKFFGDINSDQPLQATLFYTPADFNSEFQKVTNITAQINDPVLDMSLDGPQEIAANETVNLKINYKNLTDGALNNIKIKTVLPANFQLTASNPQINDDQSWTIAKIDPNGQGVIDLKGNFSPETTGTQNIKIQIGQTDNNSFYLQKEQIFSPQVAGSNFSLTLKQNNAQNDQTIQFGDTLNYTISYKNTSQAEADNLSLALHLLTNSANNKSALDWQTIEDKYDGDAAGKQISDLLRDGIITWDKKKIPALAKVAPGQEILIDLKIKTKDYKTLSAWQVDEFNIESSVEAKYTAQGQTKTIKSNMIKAQINANLNLTAEGRYYDNNGNAIGSGPLPPRVGQTTKYKIFWKLTNSFHDVSNLTVSTTLPGNVDWTNSAHADLGDIKFDSTTRKVSWTLSSMTAKTANLSTNFEVQSTPSANQINQPLVLTSTINLTATDAITKGIITKSLKALTSLLESDPRASGRGLVAQ